MLLLKTTNLYMGPTMASNNQWHRQDLVPWGGKNLGLSRDNLSHKKDTK